MQTVVVNEPSRTLLDRVRRDGPDRTDAAALRASLRDTPPTAADRRDRDCAAHMLHYLDDPNQILGLGLDHLRHEIGTARADAGLVDEADTTYLPTVVTGSSRDEVESTASLPLPNQHPVVRSVWTSVGSVSFDRVAGNRHLGSLHGDFAVLGTTAMLAAPIRFEGVGLGLLCLDETDGPRRFTGTDRQRVDRFVARHLAPLLAVAVRRRAVQSVELTPAEAEAVRLLATGRSYSRIASELGKSSRTIDNQLRSARRKTATTNAVELVAWWAARDSGPGGTPPSTR